MAIVKDAEENRMKLKVEWVSMASLRNGPGWGRVLSAMHAKPPSWYAVSGSRLRTGPE
jgi:hypothetical protein